MIDEEQNNFNQNFPGIPVSGFHQPRPEATHEVCKKTSGINFLQFMIFKLLC